MVGGDLETGGVVLVIVVGSGVGLSAGGCSVTVVGCEVVIVVEVSGVASTTGRLVDSAIRLLIVGGSGLGIGFSTGFVRPSFIS